eukprot:187770-Rhodomonas_salina.1
MLLGIATRSPLYKFFFKICMYQTPHESPVDFFETLRYAYPCREQCKCVAANRNHFLRILAITSIKNAGPSGRHARSLGVPGYPGTACRLTTVGSAWNTRG